MAMVQTACKQNKEIVPSSAFAAYINSYSGGQMSAYSTIKIEFTQDQPMVEIGVAIDDKLFNFSPSLKGEAHWVDRRTIEFVPDSGALKSGTLYNAEFKLDEVMEVEKDLQEFAFSFRVQGLNFSFDVDAIEVLSADASKVNISGEIRLSDKSSLEKVEKMLLVSFDGDNSYATKVLATPNELIYRFEIDNILKAADDKQMRLEFDGKSLGIDKKVAKEILIPALSSFRVLEAKMIQVPENGIQIIFSEPLFKSQGLRGLIDVAGISNYVFEIDNNKINVFFERNKLTSINLDVHGAVRNHAEKKLGSTTSFVLDVESVNPQIVLTSSGMILPDSKNLILPFKTVNISAVDVKIIQIFEKNIMIFLQNNTLSSENELRRSGRLVYSTTIQLDADPTLKLSEWADSYIDLAEIFNREPGAIYRVELGFKKEYSLYGRAHNASGKVQNKALTKILAPQLTEDDDRFWDIASPYYYSGSYENMDWDIYDWEDIQDPSKPSFYMLKSNISTYCNLIASNIGLIAKANQDNYLWLTTNSILTTEPLAEVDVKAYNFQLQVVGEGKTDKNGFASFPCKGKPFVVVAQKDQDKAYLRVVDGEEKSLTRFDIEGKETQKGLKGYIFGERGVWRPGDTLHLGFILEDRLNKIPDNHPVALELYNPNGQFYAKQISTKGKDGFYVFNVPTNADDITGMWSAYVKLGGASFYKSLRIEMIKPNRLKVNLNIPVSRLEASSGTVKAKLSSNWLTGAIARELKVSVEMTLSRVRTQFKGFEKYEFNNPASSFVSETVSVFEGKLDDNGMVDFNMTLPGASNSPGLLQATFVSRVFEPSGDVSTFVQSMPYSPFSSYIGLNLNEKENEYALETDKNNLFDIVTLNADGKLIDRQNIEYKIYKMNWSWWWHRNSTSFDSYINNSSIEALFSGKLSTKGGKASINFQIDYPEWGRYLVYVVDKESGHATGKVVYVDWPEWRGRAAKNDADGVNMLSFSVDKKSYEVGEEVTVIIPSAAKGRALLALENGTSVLSRAWVDISEGGDTKYKFKVTEDMAPNFYVHISLLQAHAQTVNSLPIRMYGVVPVMVTNKNSNLLPEISMPESLEPEKEFTVKIKESKGRAMSYTLAIVDEGLLDLTAFKTPDPWSEFYSRDALSIRTWDMYDYVIGAFGANFSPLFSIGGDESMKSGNTKANRFKPVVKFIGPFALNKNGSGTHKITLPMYVGSVRVMVVAAQEGAYGNAEKTVPVKSPLMILPTLPRVVSVGEEIKLPVNVFVMENNIKDVSVKVSTTGLTKISDAATRSLQFNAVGDKMAYFNLKVGSQTGIEKITVTASANGKIASETIEIDVRNPNPAVISNTDALIAPSKEQEFDFALGNKSAESWVKIELSRIPSADINRRFDYLESYEHCCSEQLVSKAFPLLYIEQFKELSPKESETVKKNVREAIRLLYARQMADGAFMYWPGQTYQYAWVINYVGHFLVEAQKKGYDVNAGVLSRWKKFQKNKAQQWTYNSPNSEKYRYHQSDLEQSYRLYTLALAGVPELGAMNRLQEIKDLTTQSRWRLAAAYALDGKTKHAKELIFNIPSEIDAYTSNNASFGSSYRDEAMILETMVLLGDIKKAFIQANKISKNLSSESYFSTQTTAYSLLAMAKLAEKVGDGMIDAEWSVNGQTQKAVKTAKAVYQLSIPDNILEGKIKLKNLGKGDLFVNLTSKYKPLIDSLQAVSNNLQINISYTSTGGIPMDVSRLQQGSDFVALVSVTNTSIVNDYNELALTHIFPAGWEIYNQRMMTTDDQQGEGSRTFSYQDIRDDRVFTYFNLFRGQSKIFRIRLQAAYIGKYTLPAVQCEAMYDTGAQARTRSGIVEVLE
ncbi:hypothetical protein AwDysgo_13160 [Bacteroidales bacterium]|nr:hypothetical protein AwDysgo_13160 [Bacteroidales bacterium]